MSQGQACDSCNRLPHHLGGIEPIRCTRCRHHICTRCIQDQMYNGIIGRIRCPIARCRGLIPENSFRDIPQHVIDSWKEKCAGIERHLRGEDAEEEQPAAKRARIHIPEYLEANGEDMGTGFGQLTVRTQYLMANGFSLEEVQDRLQNEAIIPTVHRINCLICRDEIPAGGGIVLKNCLHMFCKSCLALYISSSNTAEVRCPLPECAHAILPREVRELCSQEVYDRHYVHLSLQAAEQSPQMAHCMTPECPYFCELIEEDRFTCPVCHAFNCNTCKAQHGGMSCEEFTAQTEVSMMEGRIGDQENQTNEGDGEEDEERQGLIQRQRNELLSREEIDRKTKDGTYRACPNCSVLIEKRLGCDHMHCILCHTDFGWSEIHPDPSKRRRIQFEVDVLIPPEPPYRFRRRRARFAPRRPRRRNQRGG